MILLQPKNRINSNESRIAMLHGRGHLVAIQTANSGTRSVRLFDVVFCGVSILCFAATADRPDNVLVLHSYDQGWPGRTGRMSILVHLRR